MPMIVTPRFARLGTLFTVAALAISPAMAAPTNGSATNPAATSSTAGSDNNAPAMTTAAPMTTGSSPAAANNNNGPNGTLKQASNGDFRTSQLVGATVYGEDGNSIGTVNDLLLDQQGTIKQAVISVGGFLGIGNKLVAVDWDQLKLQPSQNSHNNNANTMTAAGGAGGAVSTTATAPGVVGAPGNTATGIAGNNAATAANGTTGSASNVGDNVVRTDYSLVMPSATKQTLTKMPSFNYTPDNG